MAQHTTAVWCPVGFSATEISDLNRVVPRQADFVPRYESKVHRVQSRRPLPFKSNSKSIWRPLWVADESRTGHEFFWGAPVHPCKHHRELILTHSPVERDFGSVGRPSRVKLIYRAVGYWGSFATFQGRHRNFNPLLAGMHGGIWPVQPFSYGS